MEECIRDNVMREFNTNLRDNVMRDVLINVAKLDDDQALELLKGDPDHPATAIENEMVLDFKLFVLRQIVEDMEVDYHLKPQIETFGTVEVENMDVE